jgi:glycosyltransferase involved in cell wall biosynthesis
VPFALYVGTLHEDRLDVDLVLATARRLTEFGSRLVLVGPNALAAGNAERLAASGGVLVLGPRAKDAIPAYLQHANVLVVPHIVDAFTDSLDPIKLYEYLAVGRPIVSTPVAGFREEADTAGVIVADGEGFARAVSAAASGWTPSTEHRKVPNWSDRARELRVVLDRLSVEGSVGA